MVWKDGVSGSETTETDRGGGNDSQNQCESPDPARVADAGGPWNGQFQARLRSTPGMSQATKVVVATLAVSVLLVLVLVVQLALVG